MKQDIKFNPSNPFALGDEIEGVFKSTLEQRNASYNDPAKEEFTNTPFDSFVENIEAPTPQIRRVCGIECPKN